MLYNFVDQFKDYRNDQGLSFAVISSFPDRQVMRGTIEIMMKKQIMVDITVTKFLNHKIVKRRLNFIKCLEMT